MPDISILQNKIGYTFKNTEFLHTALTHSSFANEHLSGRERSNERLEFLGDSVLSMIVCNYLYRAYPASPEGELTVWRKNVVCREALTAYAQKIGLGEHLLLGRGEEKDGREKPKILEDAFEALVGAIYLDSGSFAAVESFVLPFVRAELEKTQENPLDYKTLLQQYVQQTPGEELHYELLAEEGPDNAKTFTVCVKINSNVFGCGKGSSKKEAEQNAAREALGAYLPK